MKEMLMWGMNALMIIAPNGFRNGAPKGSWSSPVCPRAPGRWACGGSMFLITGGVSY